MKTLSLNGKAVAVNGRDKSTGKLIVQVVSRCSGVGTYGASFLVKARNVIEHVPFVSLCDECGQGINLNSFPHCEMPARCYKQRATMSSGKQFLIACAMCDV